MKTLPPFRSILNFISIKKTTVLLLFPLLSVSVAYALTESLKISKSETTFTFGMDNKTGKPYAIEKSVDYFTFAESSKNIARLAYFDDNSEILKSFHSIGGRERKSGQNISYQSIDGLFYTDVKRCVITEKFSKEDVQPGLGFEKKYHDLIYLVRAFFHDQHPVESKTIVFEIPEWLELELMPYNFEGYSIQTSVEKVPGKNFTRHTFTIENIEGIPNEPYSAGMAKTFPHILILSKAYTHNGVRHKLLEDVGDLYAWYRSLTSQLSYSGPAIKSLAENLTQNKNSGLEKIESIYYWVQDNIRYIAFADGIAGYKPAEAHEVLEKKYGDCKGMANLTKALLLNAGFDARLAWVGTDIIPYDYSIPSLAVDNHMICAVLFNNEWLILDATEKFCALQEHAERIQGRQVLIENNNDFLLEFVPRHQAAENLVEENFTFKIQDRTIAGTGTVKLRGEMKRQFLSLLNSTVKKDEEKLLLQYLSSGNRQFKLVSYTISNRDKRKEDVIITYHFELDNYVSGFDNDLFFEFDFRKKLLNLSLSENRVSRLYFGEKIKSETLIDIIIPTGYSIKHLPENLQVEHPLFSFNVNFARHEGKITVSYNKEIPNGEIPPPAFSEWNKAIGALNSSLRDQIIITKN